MQKFKTSPLIIAIILGGLGLAALARSQERGGTQHYEVAIIKYDGPDRLQYITPNRNEYVRLFKEVPLPKDMHDEEFCLMYAANQLAKDGWEPVNLNATRIMMRRAVR